MFSFETSTAARTGTGIRRPRQERGQHTLDALMASTRELLEEAGECPLTVRAVCARAGCSTGAFYKRFEGVAALMDAVFADLDRRMRRAASARAERWPDLPAADVIGDAVAFVIDGYRRHPGTLRALLRAGAKQPAYHQRASGLLSLISKLLGGRLVREREVIAHGNVERAADFALRQVFAVLDQKLLFGDLNPVRYRPGWPELNRELARSARAYLLRGA